MSSVVLNHSMRGERERERRENGKEGEYMGRKERREKEGRGREGREEKG